jgi:hypothetical protein
MLTYTYKAKKLNYVIFTKEISELSTKADQLEWRRLKPWRNSTPNMRVKGFN